MASCNRINKKLDVMDEQQHLFTYTVSYAPLKYSAPAYVTPGQTTVEHYFHNQPTPSKDYHQQLPPPKTYQPPPSTSPTSYQQLSLTSAATATSLLHQNHQPQPSNAHQPPPPPNTHQPPCQTIAAPTAQCHNYPQPPLPYLQQRPQSYWQPPVTAAAAASLPHQNYQPDG
ncbi:extensin-like [Salvia splendens]|uniref:extensin-like n=1 Tax=Salvia splendens TaxID=180675 RepID=UPI001C26B91A|nr:extensin-like [Salvia splendens]